MTRVATVIMPRRFCGPPGRANGGYAAGTLARHVRGPAEVTLWRAPPLDRPLAVSREAARVLLRDGSHLIAEASTTTVDVDVPQPVDLDTARAASLSSPFRDSARHPFPKCFACGPERDDVDALRLFAGRVPGADRFATAWTPTDVSHEIVWAALDCPSAAVLFLDDDSPPTHVLGRISARIDHPPEAGAAHVIMSWPLGREGRKVFSASAIYDRAARVCRGRARHVDPGEPGRLTVWNVTGLPSWTRRSRCSTRPPSSVPSTPSGSCAAQAPVCEPAPGMFAVSRYEDAVAILKDPSRFSSRSPLGPFATFGPSPVQDAIDDVLGDCPEIPTLLNNDPPEQARIRSSVSRVFTARQVQTLEPRIAEIVEETCAPWLDRGRWSSRRSSPGRCPRR